MATKTSDRGHNFGRQSVVLVVRSPMNPLVWCLVLACGHEAWVTSQSKPTRKTALCPHCPRKG
jgi:hypothetical protein